MVELENLKTVNNWYNFYSKENEKWLFQKEYIQHLEHYLDNFAGEYERKASLIKMPTGTGKTAIMSLVSNYLLPQKNILIVVPSEALKTQIKNYLNYKHWIKNKKRPFSIKSSFYFEPSTLEEKFEKYSKIKCNYICTTKTLSMLKYESNYSQLFDKLKIFIDVLFVDEGHREPAKTWSKAVREFDKPTILFTATPYRNDSRFFNLGKSFRELKFQIARDKYKAIRNVEFIYSENDLPNHVLTKSDTINHQVELFLKEFFQHSENNGIKKPKAIIRCENSEVIKKIKKEIEQQVKFYIKMDDTRFWDRTIAVGIHDTFQNKNGNYNSIDNTNKEDFDAIFWIHQYKLMEGIDNSDYFFIWFYNPYSNARSLVQQIGRIIRNHYSKKQSVAYVYSQRRYDLEKQWGGYLSYEFSDNKIIGTEDIVKRIMASFPDYFYYDKNFSKYIKESDFEDEYIELIEKELSIPKVTNIYKVSKSDYDISKILFELSDNLEDNDTIKIKTIPFTKLNTNMGVYIGMKIKQSEYLSERIFFDISFVIYVFFIVDDYLFYRGDSNLLNYFPPNIISQLEPKELEKLLYSSQKETIIKQISVINSDTNKSVIRRRLEGAFNITNTAPYINDHLQIVSSTVAKVGDITRYLGLTKSRLTDDKGIFVSIEAYISWIKEIVGILNNNIERLPFLNRFASPVFAPETSQPRHILIDLTLFNESYLHHLNDYEIFSESFDEASDEITWDSTKNLGRFNITLKNIKYPMKIFYKKRHYKIEPYDKATAENINDTFQNENNDTSNRKISVSATAFLKNQVIFRVITEEGYFYTDNHFFQPSLKLWGKGRFENIGLFYGLNILNNIKAEKEETGYIWPPNATTWPPNTIFNFIDSLRHYNNVKKLNKELDEKIFFVPDYLICEDKSGELADFILYSKSLNTIVFIHAKMAESLQSLSAVSFEKVSDQAIKNLRVFDPYNFSIDEILDRWSQDWTSSDGSFQLKRIRRGPSNIDKIMFTIISALKKGINREVWIIYGCGFSKSVLLDKFKQESPVYYLKHLAYSLVNCNETVSKVGAKLRIFTSV